MSIQTNKIGFTQLEFVLTALPIIPYLKLQGFADDGVKWEDTEIATLEKGADGLGYINDKANITYKGTFTLTPNSASRVPLDRLVELATVYMGKKALDYELALTVINHTTGTKTIYTGGVITTAPGGDGAGGGDGQEKKTYIMTVANKNTLPL